MKKNIMIITEIDQKFYVDITTINAANEKGEAKTHFEIEMNSDLIDLKRLDNNHPYAIGLNLASVFKESFIIPYLPVKESKRALKQELTKIYGDYDSKYIYQGALKPLTKESVTAQIIMYDLEKYYFILKVLKKLKIRQLRLPLIGYALKNNLSKYVPNKEGIFFINIGEYYTNFLIIRKDDLKTQMVIKFGIEDINNEIADVFSVEKDIAVSIRHEFGKYEGIIKWENLAAVYKKKLQTVIDNARLLYIDAIEDFNLEKIYLNVEDNDNNIVELFRELAKMDVEVIDNIKNKGNYLHYAIMNNKLLPNDIAFHMDGDINDQK